MATYSVKVMHPGREADYRAYWLHNELKDEAGEKLHSDLVGFVELVEAGNKAEAHAKVRAMHPGLTVDAEATERLG